MLERGILVARRAGRAQPEGRGTQLPECVAGHRKQAADSRHNLAGLRQRVALPQDGVAWLHETVAVFREKVAERDDKVAALRDGVAAFGKR